MLSRTVLLMVVILAVHASVAASARDLEAMQGEWVVDHAESPTGEILKAYEGTMRHTVRGSKAYHSEKGQTVETSFVLDDTNFPSRQLVTRHKGQIGRAIYRIDGDKQTVIVLCGPDQDWPTEFKPGPFDLVLVFRRVTQ
ncbi:MAG TPA: hypothetical protein VMF30_10410 [Pirellulales bacterium]|nr:hypothetical protein [Pirellulales bacterium]